MKRMSLMMLSLMMSMLLVSMFFDDDWRWLIYLMLL